MSKKTKALTQVQPSADVRTAVSFGDPERSMAHQMGINLESSADVRTEQAVFAQNVASYNLIQAGLLLSSVKSEMEPEAFEALIESRGLTKRRAYELMQGASFCARLPEHSRQEVLHLQKSKVLALAAAEPEVVQVLLEDGDSDVGALSVRALRERIRDLEEALTDRDVQVQIAKDEATTAKKVASRAKKKREDEVPEAIADLRAEMAVLIEGACRSIASMYQVGSELAILSDSEEAHGWVAPTAEIAFSGLVAVHMAVIGEMRRLVDAFQIKPADVAGLVDPAYGLTEVELTEVARKWDTATRRSDWERRMREWEREQARPRGKGRPSAKPEKPEGLDE